jgi:hypothetical protein
MTSKLPIELTQTPTIEGICPSCGHTGEFTLLGVQKWPARVAQAAGVPEVVGLYQCACCKTTVSEVDLLKSIA